MTASQILKTEMKVLREKKEDTCCKCGAKSSLTMAHKLCYISYTDEIEKTCWKCGYKWDVKPKDHKDET